MKTFAIYWLPVVIWAILIFYLSNQPGLKITEGGLDLLLRKIAHVTEYFVLYLLIYRALVKSFGKNFKIALLAFILTILYAASDEYHQTFVTLREGKATDIFIDSVGALFGSALVRVQR